MDKLSLVLFVVFLSLSSTGCSGSGSVRVRKNDSSLDSLRIADSLRVVDSLRIVDSIRVEDSLTILKYARATDELVEKQQQQQRLELERQELIRARIEEEQHAEIPEENNSGEVVISPDDEYGAEIDSLQDKIDQIKSQMHADRYFSKVVEYDSIDVQKYMRYLLQENFKDTSEVLRCCEQLCTIFNLEISTRQILLKRRSGNMGPVILGDMRRIRNILKETGDFMIALSPEKRVQILYEPKKLSIDEFEME